MEFLGLRVHQEGDREIQYSLVFIDNGEEVEIGCTVFYGSGICGAKLPPAPGWINLQENYFKPPCPKELAKELLRRSGCSSTSVELVDDEFAGYVDVGE